MVGKVQEVVVRFLAELQGSAILQKNASGSAFHQDCSERRQEDLENRQSNFSGSNETSNGCNIYIYVYIYMLTPQEPPKTKFSLVFSKKTTVFSPSTSQIFSQA
jgi:hypothetical protein